eukprot:8371379-Alexandrium_andersonii.AAC.1
MGELALLRGCSFLVGADLNCGVSDIPDLQMELLAGRWVDLGASPLLTHGGLPQGTCQAHGAKGTTRRDYWLCSPEVHSWCRELK